MADDLNQRWGRFVDGLGVIGAAGQRLRYLALEVGLAAVRLSFDTSDRAVVSRPERLAPLPLWRHQSPN